MFTGDSASAIAKAESPDGTLLACEVGVCVTSMARNLFDRSAHGSKIEVAIAPAIETLRKRAAVGETFDFVFTDADKKEHVQCFATLLDSILVIPNGCT